jgi:hypothetical protein
MKQDRKNPDGNYFQQAAVQAATSRYDACDCGSGTSSPAIRGCVRELRSQLLETNQYDHQRIPYPSSRRV